MVVSLTILSTLVSCLVFLLGHGQAFEMRWCTTSNEEQSKCNDFKDVLKKLNNAVTPGCIQAESAVECMKKISGGQADLITLDGGDVYKAGKEFGMAPVVSEDYGYGTLSYYAVAVVKKSNTDIQFNKLEGKMTCHTGAGKTAGWNVPVGTLLAKKYIKYDSTCNPYVAAGKYFKESCVPRVKLPSYDAKGENPDSLCALCKDECKKDGNYSGYSGAFRCMDEGVGEVAFVKHTTVKENKPGMETNYQYLCKDGTRKEIGQHLQCNLALVPSHAVMTSKGNANKADYVRILLEASKQYGNDSGNFTLFDSSKYGGGTKRDLLFKDSTVELKDVSDRSYAEFLGDDYMAVIKGLNECPTVDGAFQMRWCTTSVEEQSKCNDFKDALKNIDIAITPGCVKAGSAVECMKKISDGDADLITLDGGDVYKAGKEFGMVPVVSEDYGYGTLSYYAVAVVKKSNTDIQFDNLKGKKTCHTGAGKTAGWNVPVGTLLAKKYIQLTGGSSCNPYVAAGNYFKESCVPRVKLPAYDAKGENPDSLCALCKDECKKDGNYSGYSGAFRCMDDGVGEVAFVKHTTVKENKPEMETNYQYLCKDGTRKEIGQHLHCNLALVPSHAVMTSEGNTDRTNYVRVLLAASALYGSDSGSFALFDSKRYGGGTKKDLLFKDSTVELKNVSDKTFAEFLGDDYVAVIKGLNECVAVDGGKDILKPYFLASVVLAFVALVLSGTAE